MYTLKRHPLFAALAASLLLASCSKTEPDMPDVVDNAPPTEILVKALGNPGIDTRAAITGTSLHGKAADVFAMTTKFIDATNYNTLFSTAYARGTMTFDDARYVGFDEATLVGNALLPQNPTAPVYLYGFYPAGWTIALCPRDINFESLSTTFDGSKDVMMTYIGVDEVEIQYGTAKDKANLIFKHILTRYNIQVKGNDAEAQTVWGSVKSIAVKDAAMAKNTVEFQRKDILNYYHDAAKPTPAFFKLGGTTATPTYTDIKFEAADFTASQQLTQTYANACYAMINPINVDTDNTTPEIVLEVVTMDKDASAGGKERKTEVPISLDQSKFTANGTSTVGYSITITLNFRAGAIQAIASVEEWKDGGQQDEDVDITEPTPPKIGQFRDGGIVFWIDQIDPMKYKVVSLEDWERIYWANNTQYVIGSEAQSVIDGKANSAAIKAAFDSGVATAPISESTFAEAFPAAATCYNYQGKDNKDTKGSWYLPAQNELQYLAGAYNGSPGNLTFTENTTAQAMFDSYLTNAGGSGINSVYSTHWSSTELSRAPTGAVYVNCITGYEGNYHKASTYTIRCIKSF